MKQRILNSIFCFLCLLAQAQHEFHVFPNGKSTGNGTLQNPWDLQTALSQKTNVVNGGDTIWLHQGIYNGRFLSTIASDIDQAFITVAPYLGGKVILNGNVASNRNAVLSIKGKQVIFRDFEITSLGAFSRDENDAQFQVCAGISHTAGEDCRFYNLDIHDNPGLGIGSWKWTGGSIIENCRIYFNGFVAKDGKGRGEGIYVQNTSDHVRLIQNNIIFGNYYKGIEVWSAGRDANFEYVKNITLKDNVIFNSGLPSGNSYDNVIVATDDRNGTNFAHHINVLGNIFYHNTDYADNQVNGNAPSLTIGYVDNAPAEDILVKDNIILGRNNPLRLLHVKSLTFFNNTVYGGYVFLNAGQMEYSKNWNFGNNTYFTKNNNAYRVLQDKNYSLKDWQSKFKLDIDSHWNHIKDFDLMNVLGIAQNAQRPNTFRVALFNKQGDDVEVDFSGYNLSKGSSYSIYDVENPNEIAATGILNGDRKVMFPMGLAKLKKPRHNEAYQKTPSNFGVFIIQFETEKTGSVQALNGFQKLLKWLGF
ncbi:MAG: right-handed parallel beta-helix repeat-containing protein [Gelidibacter sp.]